MEKPELPPSREHVEPKCSTQPHIHKAPDGSLVKCYHECKNTLRSPSFWVLTTFAFPLEHFIWTKIPILSGIAHWAGLVH